MKQSTLISASLGISLALALLAAPAIGQNQDEKPESLLPPGFEKPGTPPPASPPPASAPRPATPPPAGQPAPDQARPPAARPPAPSDAPRLEFELDEGRPAASASEQTGRETRQSEAVDDTPPPLEESIDSQLARAQSLPPGVERSLSQIGVWSEEQGGYSADSLGPAGGKYVLTLLRNMHGRLVSRWGMIGLRRALLSPLRTPRGINGADWAAVRASLLLRLGDADAARRLVQAVDAPNTSPMLQQVALNVYLASADPAGICPILPFVSAAKDDAQWQLIRAICASFSGEQSVASERMNRAERNGIASEIDIRLAEKAVGAGINGRRAVVIDWGVADRLTRWRFGLGLTTGVEPPDELYLGASPVYQAWRARAPMLSFESRVKASNWAAAMGVLSSQSMVDLYSAAWDDSESSGEIRGLAEQLRDAYILADARDRLAAMRSLWTSDNRNDLQYYSRLILTARAAALVPVGSLDQMDVDHLIVSMLSAGLDNSAMRWIDAIQPGTLAWAEMALARPGSNISINGGPVADFINNDSSTERRKSAFLVAGLLGLGRLGRNEATDYLSDLGTSLGKRTRWSRAIVAAAQRGDSAMVMILAAAGMQGDDWSQMTPLHLYHIVAALNEVGLQAEARMIAAEAVARA